MRSVSMTIPAALVAQVRDGLLEVERVRRDALAHAGAGVAGQSGGGESGGESAEPAPDLETIEALAAQLDRVQPGDPVEVTGDPALLRAAGADALLACAETVEADSRAYLETGRGDGLRRRAGELVALVELLDELPAAG